MSSLSSVKPLAFLALILYGLFLSSAQGVSQEDIIEFSLFDIQVTIPNDFKILNPGDELLATIKLVNLGSAGRIDVFLDYWITDSEQNVVLRSKETVAVETQASFVRTFNIPEEMEPGKYSLYAKLTYADGKEAIANNSFEIAENKVDRQPYYTIIIIAIIGLIILVYIIIKSRSLFERMKIRAKVLRMIRSRKIKK